jgi:hypothetical protein
MGASTRVSFNKWIKKSVKEGQGPVRTVEASWEKKEKVLMK